MRTIAPLKRFAFCFPNGCFRAMRTRRHLYVFTRGNATAAPYIDLQLRPAELQAIGHVTAQWAFLEFLILRETRNLARHLGRSTPEDAEAISFRRRRELWEKLSREVLSTYDEELRRALDCIERVRNLASERHRLIHDIIEYDTEDRNRLKAYPRATLGNFGWPLSAKRIEKTALNIARLNHAILSIHRDPEPAPSGLRRIRDRQAPLSEPP